MGKTKREHREHEVEHAGPTAHEASSRPRREAWGGLGNRLLARSTPPAQAGLGNRIAAADSTSGGASLPSRLTAGLAALSGFDLSHVRVHYNATRPASLDALACAQGDAIHIAPGHERHLAHEAWHLVQQRRSSGHAAGGVLRDPALEREADTMGARAWEAGGGHPAVQGARLRLGESAPVQLVAAKDLAALRIKIGNRVQKAQQSWWTLKERRYNWAEFKSWLYHSAKGTFSSVEAVDTWLSERTTDKAADDIVQLFGGKSEAPEVPESEERRELIELIVQMIARDNERSQRRPKVDRVETPVFSIEVRKRLLGLTGAKPDANAVRISAKLLDDDELRSVVEEAIMTRDLWASRNEFTEEVVPQGRHNTVSFSRFRHTGLPLYDRDYQVLESEIDLWNHFLDRHVPLPKHPIARELRDKLTGIKKRAAALVTAPNWTVQRLVGAHAKLKAERMKLSNTVLAGNEENIKNGRGDLVANTPSGKQWETTEQHMLQQATQSHKSGRCKVTPEMILELNALESSEKGLVNSQGPGELRYSAVLIGSKAQTNHNQSSYSLRTLPPSMIGGKLAALISRTNLYLSRVRSDHDLWLLIPIASRFFTDFISIHPFPDGNGRTARRVVDYMFLSFGLPPAQFDKSSNNFGAGVPDILGQEPEIERVFSDEEGWAYMLKALESAIDTLETGIEN